MLITVVAGIFSAATIWGQTPAAPKVTRDERVQWFNDARFGMMIHWGAYSLAGGVWKGQFEGGYSEWLKFRQIPNVEYDSMIREFNPVGFDAEKWVKIAHDAGMKYIVFTAKHHDGFALYDSKVSTYDIMDMTRFGRDPLAELAAACQRAGLKFGVYYSVDRDWHHPDAACDGRYNQCNFWDYPENKLPGAMERWHNSYFPNYALKQVTELVTRYPIDIVWFDGIGLKTRAEIAQLDSVIHTNRPWCLINSRISNFFNSNDGDYGSKGDNETPGGYQAGGWENPGTLGFSYAYSVKDSFMGPKQAVHNLIEMVSKGGNYLLNVGPDGNGVIIPEAADILGKMGSWVNIYGTSIYGCDGVPVKPPENTRITVKPHQMFVHVLEWTGKEIVLEEIGKFTGKYLSGVNRVYMFTDGQKRQLKFTWNGSRLAIDPASCPLPLSKLNPFAEVIVVSDEPLQACVSPYSGWKYSGSMFILTTPEGADLKVSALEKDFPLLVRLDKASFLFNQAGPEGEDIRFTDAGGNPLAYQLEQWDPAGGSAAIWVKIPEIRGNTRQEIRMYWGLKGAKSESDGSAVFNKSNGYLAVLHMGDALRDETGTLQPVNAGTTLTPGMIGMARHLKEGQGVNCGENITAFPTGSSAFTTEAWFRPEGTDGIIAGFGNEEPRGKVIMQYSNPPMIRLDCYWSGANISSSGNLGRGGWIHSAHTYRYGQSSLYVNGKPDGFSASVKNPLNIKSPAKMFLGGWMNDYWFNGEIDEVRISNVARSADWVRLGYENQKPVQTLVGPIVAPGNEFSVTPAVIGIAEGKSATVAAKAGGALKTYWLIRRGGTETVMAADRTTLTFDAGRVTMDEEAQVVFKAVYADTVKMITIPVRIREAIPEPVVTLKGPAEWNGRDTIRIVPVVSNFGAMKSKGAGQLNFKWSVTGGAVIIDNFSGGGVETFKNVSSTHQDKSSKELVINRSQYTGPISVNLALDNGGTPTKAILPILVKEPASDPWVYRKPGRDEQPEDNQFFARDDKNEGTLFYNGTLKETAESVFLRVYADNQLFEQVERKLLNDRRFSFTVKLKPGLVVYRAVFGIKTGGIETILRNVNNMVCGDAYIIQGQSNAEATGPNAEKDIEPAPPQSNWIRSFGNSWSGSVACGWGNAVRTRVWGQPDFGERHVGAWGMVMAANLVDKYKMPTCLMNGAVGGTRVDAHQRNQKNPNDSTTIYGRLLTRIQAAHLTHGIRGVLWHQGENNSGAASPDGDWDYKKYREYFVTLAAAWKQDFPNIKNYYVYQVWPLPCMMGPTDDQLREEQRRLPELFSNMRVMSTLGIVFPGSGKGMCHFDLEGYRQLAMLMSPLVEHDNYGLVPDRTITAPNLKRAWFTTATHDEIALDFGQPVVWNDEILKNIYLDGRNVISDNISGGGEETFLNVSTTHVVNSSKRDNPVGNVLRMKFSRPVNAHTISYLSGKDWDGSAKNLLFGTNGIAALTFWEVGIE